MTAMASRVAGRSGLVLTVAGLGCAGIGGLFAACPEDRAAATLQGAWDAGIRYFDTAPFYGSGLSEARLGRFLAGKPREAVVVSTKAGRLLHPQPKGKAPDYGFVGGYPARVSFDYSGDGILRSVADSLTRMGLDRIDIVYVHDIGNWAHGPEAGARHLRDLLGSGIPALERLKAEGTVRAWGLGVNEVEVCLTVAAQVPPEIILLAGRLTLLDRRAEARLLPLVARQGGSLVIGGVFNSGILATGPVAEARFDYAPAPDAIRDRVGAIRAVCAAAGEDPVAAALQFPLSRPAVASVLVGAAAPDVLARNLAALAAPVDPAIFDRTRPYAITG